MASCSSVQSAVEAMMGGAYDVIAKPFGFADLKHQLQNVGNHLKAKTESRFEFEKNKSARGRSGICLCEACSRAVSL